MVRIAVIDGQGASIGSTIIRKIRQTYGEKVEIWALGTNAIATGQMLKAGANRGATGESAVCHCAHQVDVIIGPISILISNAMMGEVTPAMAHGRRCFQRREAPPAPFDGTRYGRWSCARSLPHLVDKLIKSIYPVSSGTRRAPEAPECWAGDVLRGPAWGSDQLGMRLQNSS